MKRTQEQRAIERFEIVMRGKGLVAEGRHISLAAFDCGVSRATLARWTARYDDVGIKGLRDLPRSGRPVKQFNPSAE